MKRRFIILLLGMILILTGCGGITAGHRREMAESTLYTEAEIDRMMDLVVDHFGKEFDGCTLLELRYETEYESAAAEWAEQYQARYAAIFTSDFKVDHTGGDGSLSPDFTYRDWQWILTSEDRENWTLRTWGYG